MTCSVRRHMSPLRNLSARTLHRDTTASVHQPHEQPIDLDQSVHQKQDKPVDAKAIDQPVTDFRLYSLKTARCFWLWS